MSKYCYEKGEVVICDSQCDGCIYEKKDTNTECEQYSKIPDEILTNQCCCPHYEKEGMIKL